MFNILYVDDDLALLDIGKIYLEKIGEFYVDVTTSALSALNLILSKKYDAIIADYEMPMMNGIELLQKVRHSGNNIPFILFTGRGREEVVIQALNEGADFYLQKGGDPKPQFTELTHKVILAVQKRISETALSESEERYKAIVEDQTELICRFTPDRKLTFVNDAFCRYYNLERNRCLSHPPTIILPPEDAVLVRQHLKSLSSENPVAYIEHRVCMSDGTIRWQRWNDRAIFGMDGQIIEYQSVGRDITDRIQNEVALRKSEEKYRELFSSISDAIFVFDFTGLDTAIGNFKEVNTKACQMLCYTYDELLSMSPFDVVASDFYINLEQIVEQLTQGKDVSYEHVFLKKDQKRIPVEIHQQAFTHNGKWMVISLVQDITERKRIQKALRESEEHFRILFNNSNDAMVVYRLTPDMQPGKIIDVNDIICRYYGYSRDEFFQMKLPDICSYRDKLFLSQEVMNNLIADGHARREIVHKFKDGREIPVELVYTLLKQNGEMRILLSARDITERKRVENTLRQLNRQLNLMTVITRHDIINQVTVIQGILDCIKDYSPDPALQEFIQKIVLATDKIQSQITFTKVYQDLGSKEPQWLDINKILHNLQIIETITITSNLKGIEIYTDTMFEKVFYNLLDNSIRHGERVTKIQVSFIETDNGLRIIWEDDGMGIAKNSKERIFHRGFGQNNGFGLFFVREILSLSGASISETGVYGVGARFEILVPKDMYRRVQAEEEIDCFV